MPAPIEDGGDALQLAQAPREWTVLRQRVYLDVDFANRSLKGSTEITVEPLVRDLTYIRLHCRQCKPLDIQVAGLPAEWKYDNAYSRTHMGAKSTVNQHKMLKGRIQSSLRPLPAPQLHIALPPKVKITEIPSETKAALPLVNGTPALQKSEGDAMAAAAVPVAETPMFERAQPQLMSFAPIKITIEFEVDDFRDGIHWAGFEEKDKRYPHLYTKLEPWPGNTSSIFPCLDDATSRCSWELAIRCPRTLGDAFRKPKTIQIAPKEALEKQADGDVQMVNGIEPVSKAESAKGSVPDEYTIDLNAEDAALDLVVLCVGEVQDDVADADDETRHTITFNLDKAGSSTVTARHIGFAIGPFEQVDLTTSRDIGEEAKLGQVAFKVDGFCLPGRADEVDNTCFPLCQALDCLNVEFGRYPFVSYQLLFVDDLTYDATAAAGLSICSSRLLFPEDIIDPLDGHTRILIRALADQWSGVNIVAKEPTDNWAIAGIAGYMSDFYMQKLAGNNQYRWEQKLASEKVYELDVDRPSIHQLGTLLHVDFTIRDFLNLKSGLVLGILDRRLVKSSGSTGVRRIINKIMLNATSDALYNRELSTQDFQKTCERLGHNKLDAFFRQWVFGAGCPIFFCSQRFNKKKLVVEMTITQRQLDRQTKPAFEPSNFMREVKEHVQEVWAPETQAIFTGPMTIRIHEADGTPYEHIVEIKEAVTKLEIPYNTKYKRLKRSKRQRERAMADGNTGTEGEGESLLYCLGDILDSEQEMSDWNLEDWSKEEEDKMGQESYEWIRLDADFEWIGNIHFVMPLYMYISQLQQDRDLVAQYESIKYLLGSNPHHTSLTILVRTLMDKRYFHGIRTMAADGIARLAKDKLLPIGQHHLTKAFASMFCENDTSFMPRPNDFSDRVNFIMQCAIPKAMAKLRDPEGKVPLEIRQFFVDKLKFNDNSDNAFSDCHYVAKLMECLADSLVVSHRLIYPAQPVTQQYEFNFGDEEPEEPDEPEEPYNPDADFELMAVNEIERYRRIDEWISTYQNVYSTTAIHCLQKLTKAGIVKDKTKELLLYMRPSTADNVRVEAFKCMNELGLTRRMPMMKHLLYSLVSDPSPYFRDRMLRLFGEALGHIALGDDSAEKPPAPAPADTLVLESDANLEAKRAEMMRKTTPEGALAALKTIMQHEEVFKQALWYAATSPDIALDETAAFCDVAALMFEPVVSHIVEMKLPRPYKCAHEGRGKVRFWQQGAFRTKPSKGLVLDDYETLEQLGLKYTGPLAEDTKRYLAREEEPIKLRLGQSLSTAQSTMPPPALPTPIAEKTGFKINLGPPKRKPTEDIAKSEGTPKAIKISKTSTPSTSRKPSSAAAVRSRKVVLQLGQNGARRAQEILSSPPQPGRSLTRSPSVSFQSQSRSITPGSTFAASTANGRASPSAGGFSSPITSLTQPKPISLNVGGFRSFGPTPDGKTAAPFVVSPAAESPAAPNGLAKSPPHPLSLTNRVPSVSNSPPAPATNDEKAMAPPLKKKLTIKLGVKSQTPGFNKGSPPT